MKADSVARHPVLPSVLIVRATWRWCAARRRGLPCILVLHRLFTPLGLFMMAVSFDSLLSLLEQAAGRPLVAGRADQLTRDQRGIEALLATGRLAAADGWLDLDASHCGLAGAIDCAVISVRRVAADLEVDFS